MFAKATAQNLVYRMFDILPDDFRRETLRLLTGGIRGLNVTLPHKQAAAELVNELTPRAARRAGGQHHRLLRGFDAARRQHRRRRPDRRSRAQPGSGARRQAHPDPRRGRRGARRGRAACWSASCASLTIANRTPYKARKLAEEFADMGAVVGCTFAELEGPPYDLIINATSASLQGVMPELPAGLVTEETVCYDMAYGRGDTPFTLLGARRCMPARVSRAGACWWSRRPSHSCSGAASGRARRRCSRRWPND